MISGFVAKHIFILAIGSVIVFFVILKLEEHTEMSLKSTLQTLSLQAKLKKIKREKKACGMAEAKSVGFVCFFEEEQQWKEIQPAVRKFQSSGAKVMVLGIYPEKVKPLWYVETMNTVMCSLSEFGMMGLPKGQKVNEFIKERFDILIDCDLSGHFSTDYICLLSCAGFKVANDTEKNRKHFDLLINMEGETELEDYITQVLFYISKFKKKDNI